jgi:predicted dehydrogenase
MSGQPLRFGVVGAGRVFTRMHLACLRERPELTLVAVCDLEPRRAADDLRASQIHPEDLLLTDDLGEFFSRGAPDIVAVCTPNNAHAEPVRRAVAHGAAVLCEKPLSGVLDEARAIASLAPAAADRPLGVNLPYRLHELLPELAARVGNRTARVEASFMTAGLRLWQPATSWYADVSRSGGGALVDLGPHVLDTLGALFGPASMRRCRVDAALEERAVLDLDYEQVTATVTIDRASRRVRFTVDVHIENGPSLSLDLRHGRLSCGDDVITAAESQPMLAGIRGFLAAAAGARGGVVVTPAQALVAEELVAQARAVAEVVPASSLGAPAAR